MKSSILQWLRPQEISRVAQLHLLARSVVEGVRGGIHKSKHVGASVNFKEHRPYVPGDEIRAMDWKLFGKTDRLYIRQYEDETNLRCILLVDQSASMRYGGAAAAGQSKYQVAVQLAACIAYLLMKQSDAVGLARFDESLRQFIPPKGHPGHLHLLMDSLANSKPSETTSLKRSLAPLLHRMQKGGVVVLISDGLGDVEEWVKSLALLRANRQEVIFFQILHPDEIDFPFSQRTLFRSLENQNDESLLDPISFRKSYLQRFELHQAELARGCQRHGIEHLVVRTTDALGDVVGGFLSRRGGRP